MPPRKATTKHSTRGQTILSFKTPTKITKGQAPHAGIKKDISSSIKKQATTPPPSPPPSPPTDPVDIVPTTSLQKPIEPQPVTQTEAESIAASFDDARIRAYYKQQILSTRRTLPVHQEELSLDEKVLRHFDLSSQYGPCIGISRIARWKRAKGLGMEPSLEVLAVCLKVEKALNGAGEKEKEGGRREVVECGLDRKRDTRRSYLDDHLSTRTARE